MGRRAPIPCPLLPFCHEVDHRLACAAALLLSRGAQWSLQRAACARQVRHGITVRPGQAGPLVVRLTAKVKGHRQRLLRLSPQHLTGTPKSRLGEDLTTEFILLRGSRLQILSLLLVARCVNDEA